MYVKVYIVNLFFYNVFYYYYINDSDVLLVEDGSLRHVMKCLLLNCCEGYILL